MIRKNFKEIIKADIDFLIDNKIGESKTLEYKQKLPGPKDSDKKEFLADISSFANASGGDIIFGIKEEVDKKGKKTGKPETIVPIQDMTSDEAKLQIENLIRSGIEPRIRVHVKEITGYGEGNRGFIIIIRIPQSFASPHMVIFNTMSRFYSRNSAGKYPLDVDEIRNSFLATASQAERIRSFVQNRLSKIMADETPVPLSTTHRLVLHIIPISSFLNKQRLQLNANSELTLDFRPICASGWEHRYNLDGFLTYNRDYEDKTVNNGYCQIFFDGTVESVHANILREKGGGKPKEGTALIAIASIAYEKYLIEAISNYFKGYKTLGVDAPVIISMTLMGCKGAYMWVDFSLGLDVHPIDRDVAVLPEVKFESLDEDIPVVIRPIFDAVWNACGCPRSFNYDGKGKWNPR
jgi:hypothetical protein